MDYVAIYTRTHNAHAWKFEKIAHRCTAELERGVNTHFNVQTLLVPAQKFCPQFLDADSTSTL